MFPSAADSSPDMEQIRLGQKTATRKNQTQNSLTQVITQQEIEQCHHQQPLIIQVPYMTCWRPMTWNLKKLVHPSPIVSNN